MARSRLSSVLVPPGVSVLVHLALLGVVAAVSVTVIRRREAAAPAGDVVVSLEHLGGERAEAAEGADSAGAVSASSALASGAAAAIAVPSGSGGVLAAPPVAVSPAVASSPAGSGAASAFSRGPTPGAAFAGLSAARVRRVVYVVDISGPMASSLSVVLDELRRSVARLDSSQYFQVILFRQELEGEGEPGALWLEAGGSGGGARLVPATAANRAALGEFLSGVRPAGRSNPLSGLRAALGLRPDVVFLLARGISRTGPNARWGEGNETILAELERLNPVVGGEGGRRRTAIKTIQFVDDDPTGLMQAIAERHGGSADSYTRRTIENLSEGVPAASLVEAPDAALDRAAALMSGLAASRADLRALFGVGDRGGAEVRRVTGEVMELLGARERDAGADELSRLLIARALVLRAATGGESPGPLLDRALGLLDTSEGAPPEVLSTAAAAHAWRQSAGDGRVAAGLARRPIVADGSTMAGLEARLAGIVATAGDSVEVGRWVEELGGAMSRAPVVASGRLDAPLALLVLEASAVARLRHARGAAGVDAALVEHLAWAREPRPGLPAEAVLVSAGRLVPGGAELDQIDPALALAVGLSRLPAAGGAPGEGALEALDLAALRAEGGTWVGESARVRAAMAVSVWASGLAQDDAGLGARSEAVGRLDRALRECPGRSWRRDAALHVLAHSGVLLEARAEASVLPARVRALRVLVIEEARAGGEGDAWRLELAHRVAQGDRGDGEGIAEAVRILGEGWGERPAEADRVEAWARSLRVGQLAEEVRLAQRGGNDAGARAAAAELVEAARVAIPAVERVDAGAADAIRADLAEALILRRSPEAAEIYGDLEARGVTLGRPAGSMALGRARALLAQGDEAGAFKVLRELTARLPEPVAGAGSEAARGVYWQAWTLTIETLAERAASVSDQEPRRTGAAHVLRLHDLDAGLGGEPWASRLRAAALSLGVDLGG